MSRIYVIICFISFSFNFLSQATKEDYIEFANTQKAKRDYITAINYYEKVLILDSENVDVLWNYSESLRLYKDYIKAEFYYQKVYDKEETKLYLRSIFYLGQMQKTNGKYSEALETFKLAKKKYAQDRNGYLYQKCKQEIESCLWAKKAIKDTLNVEFSSLPPNINTADSEFAHTFFNKQLFFSSFRADSINSQEEVYDKNYKNKILKTSLSDFSVTEEQTDLNNGKVHSANGTFSLDKKRFYFSACKEYDEGFQCKIVVAYYVEGKMRSIDTLGEIINESYSNSTMPFIANFDKHEVLLFASNRVGSKGGLDIFYSYITDGNQYSKPIAVEIINSIDDELSPFFDSKEQKLYFSSSWHNGFGLQDIFVSKFLEDKFLKPENLGLPINSAQNDIYYFKENETSYFSSNRTGVNFVKNPTCCSDIFAYTSPKPFMDTVNLIVENKQEIIEMSFEELNKKLPVTLYFHNDIPDPKSTDSTTRVNYIASYSDYVKLIPQYKREYSKGLSGEKNTDAQEDIESFFIEYVDQGVTDLELFRDLLFEELEKGNSINLTVKGFASPLAKSDYNVNLTKRRIVSLTNYLKEYEKGKFAPYLNGTNSSGTKLSIQEVPFGEYNSDKLVSDNPNDKKNSIYSRNAALERKIEIQSVNFIKRDSVNYLISTEQLKNLGKISPTKIQTVVFEIENSGTEEIEISNIEIPCTCNTAILDKKILSPKEKTKITITLDPQGYKGNIVKSVYLHVKNKKEPLRLVLTGEI
jgi:tetratricopeptide (TPR) repeat protein